MKKQKILVSSLLCGAVAALSPSLVFAQDSYWKVEDGFWSDAINWSQGVPGTAGNPTFGKFVDSYDGLQTVNLNESATVNQFRIGYGTDVHLKILNASDLTLASTLTVGAGYGTGSGAASLRVTATDAANPSTVNLALLQISGHQNGGNGNAVIFEGAGLRVNTASQVRVGTALSENSLTIKDGAQLSSTSVINVGLVSSRTNVAHGNNNRLNVEGAGSRVTVLNSAGSAALNIGNNPSGDTAPISGNRVDVTAGGFMRAAAATSTLQASVQVGTNRYSRSSSLNVDGEGSRFEAGANASGVGISIGAANASGQGFNDNRDNRVVVSNGGVIKNEGSTTLTNTYGSSQNYLRIASGGSYLASADINNRGGIIYLDNGGVLAGESADGSGSQAITVNLLNNTTYNQSTLFLEGNGLGSTVNVNAEAGSIVSIGNAANGSVTALQLDSSIHMEQDSSLRFLIFSGSNAGRIDFGAAGSLSGESTLVISFVGYTARSGDEWTIFGGNTAGIDPAFLLSTSSLPALDSGLEWDLSRLNQDGGWVLGVIPEPRTSAMAIGAGVLAAALLVKRRRMKQTA